MELKFTLHPAQLEIHQHPARYKVVVAGRRFGKTVYACTRLIVHMTQMVNRWGQDLSIRPAYYIGPTYQQAKRDTWNTFKKRAGPEGGPLVKRYYEKDQMIRFKNGRELWLLGADRPDAIRGQGLGDVVLDEYKDMKPEVWDEVVAPMLMDVKAEALLIGTPPPRGGHFLELVKRHKDDPEWAVFVYHSSSNPYIDPKEIEAAKRRMSREAYLREHEASMTAGSGTIFQDDMFQAVSDSFDIGGDYYIAVDPAGFSTEGAKISRSELSKRDETAIAVVKVGPDGWLVEDIIHGRWGVRETSVRILRAAQKYRPVSVGIERGVMKEALGPYLQDQQRRIGVYPHFVDLSHGNQNKGNRIVWALQGRLEHGRVHFRAGEYLEKLRDQAVDFPNPLIHDDLLDALAYIDQMASVVYLDQEPQDYWTPLDEGLQL